MRIWIGGKPPTATAQQKGRTKDGRWYKPAKLKAAEEFYLWGLMAHKPRVPMQGAIRLEVIFCFPSSRTHKNGTMKTTRPDTDNMVKLLKDCLTKLGFWNDDAQVSTDIIRKMYSDEAGVMITITEDNP